MLQLCKRLKCDTHRWSTCRRGRWGDSRRWAPPSRPARPVRKRSSGQAVYAAATRPHTASHWQQSRPSISANCRLDSRKQSLTKFAVRRLASALSLRESISKALGSIWRLSASTACTLSPRLALSHCSLSLSPSADAFASATRRQALTPLQRHFVAVDSRILKIRFVKKLRKPLEKKMYSWNAQHFSPFRLFRTPPKAP